MVENSRLLFKPQEIVCMESDRVWLFAEVIETIPDRNRCWVKPLALANYADFQFRLRYDLQECAQLILPLHLFRSAVDTEVVPVMMELFQIEKMPDRLADRTLLSRQALHHFIGTLSTHILHQNKATSIERVAGRE